MHLNIVLTMLLVCELIRILQNAVSLYRNNKRIKEALGDFNVTDEDLEMQRKAYKLIVEKLEGKE